MFQHSIYQTFESHSWINSIEMTLKTNQIPVNDSPTFMFKYKLFQTTYLVFQRWSLERIKIRTKNV